MLPHPGASCALFAFVLEHRGWHPQVAKAPADIRSLARAYTPNIIRQLGAWAINAKTDPDIRLRSMAILLDRGWGKPPQDTNVQAELRVTIRKMLDGKDD